MLSWYCEFALIETRLQPPGRIRTALDCNKDCFAALDCKKIASLRSQ